MGPGPASGQGVIGGGRSHESVRGDVGEPIDARRRGVRGLCDHCGRKAGGLGKAGNQPVFEGFRAQVKRGKLCGQDPIERDSGFLRRDIARHVGWVFHVEHEVEFVMGLVVRTEADLGHGEQWAHGEGEGHFLEAFQGQCARGGLAEFDVAAGEVVVVPGHVAAEEHGVVVGPPQKCARKKFYLPIICHAAEPVLCGTCSTLGLGGRMDTVPRPNTECEACRNRSRSGGWGGV